MIEIFYTDPPWAQKKGGLRKARPNQGKLELFARNRRDGWESWGDEIEVIGNIHDNQELMGE